MPGTQATDLLARVGKPSILCSNTYLLRSPEALTVIDPGADERAAARLRALLLEERRGRPRPVYVLLTHCHYDHTGALPLFLDPELEATLVCHGQGLSALVRGEEELPLPAFFGREPVPVKGGVPLFAPGPDASLSQPPGLSERADGPDGPLALLSLGGGDALSIRPTPGHTPDGLTLFLGQRAFPGDIPFAANPGVAGVPGWDAAALEASLALVNGLCREGLTLLPGHGDPLEPGIAQRVLSGQARKAGGMADIVRLDKAPLRRAGRPHRNPAGRDGAHPVHPGRPPAQGLPHPGGAGGARGPPPGCWPCWTPRGPRPCWPPCAPAGRAPRTVPCTRTSSSSRPPRPVSRLGQMLRSEDLAALAGGSLARRGQRLLADYLNEVLGLCYDAPGPSVDLGEAVAGLVDRLAGPAADPAGLLEASGDHAAFVRELTNVLADNRLFARTRLRFTPPGPPPAGRRGPPRAPGPAGRRAGTGRRGPGPGGGAFGPGPRAAASGSTIQAEPGRDLRIQAALGNYLRLALNRVSGDLAVAPDAPHRCDILLPAAPGPGANP